MTKARKREILKTLSDMSRDWSKWTRADWAPLEAELKGQAMTKIYRLTLDENGQEDCTDFSDLKDARSAFLKAARRKTVFTADVDAYDAQTFDHLGRVFHCDNE